VKKIGIITKQFLTLTTEDRPSQGYKQMSPSSPTFVKYIISIILYFLDCASLYNLVNRTNLVHNVFS